MKSGLVLSIITNIMLLVALAGCNSGTGAQIAELLSASENPDNPNAEIVCVRGSLNGRFTDADVVYLKKVYPKDQPPPEC